MTLPTLLDTSDWSHLVDVLLDIYVMTRDRKIEQKIIDLFGEDLLRRLLEDRETA